MKNESTIICCGCNCRYWYHDKDTKGRIVCRKKRKNVQAWAYRKFITYWVCEDCLYNNYAYTELNEVDSEMLLLMEECGELEAAFIYAVEYGISIPHWFIPSSIEKEQLCVRASKWASNKRAEYSEYAEYVELWDKTDDTQDKPKKHSLFEET